MTEKPPADHGAGGLALASLIFVALTVLKTYPLIRHFGTHLAYYTYPDWFQPAYPLLDAWPVAVPQLNVWILSWDFHALVTAPWSVFDGNIFYPVQNTLAFSEHMLGVLSVFGPAYALTGNPIFAYNVVFFSSYVFCGIAMFLLVRYWTRSFWASLIAGYLFAFAPLRVVTELSHLQLLNFYWTPLALLCLERFFRARRWRDLLLFAVCYWLQVLSSVYLGWLITVAVAAYGLYRVLWIDRSLLGRFMLVRYGAFVALTLLVLVPVHLPFLKASRDWGFVRSLEECVRFSLDFSLTYRGVVPQLSDVHFGTWLFPRTALLLLLAVAGLTGTASLSLDTARRMRRMFLLLLIVAFVLALGPFLVVAGENTRMPLPYLVLYYAVPGFQAMRIPARFAFLIVLAASALAALGFLRVCAFLKGQWDSRRRSALPWEAIAGLCCLTLFTLELGFRPLPLASIPTGSEVPQVYRWLADRPGAGVVVELPFGWWEDTGYMYFSTYHWRTLVNGWSGFIPPTYLQTVMALQGTPSRRMVDYLGTLGVKDLIVHTAMLPPGEAAHWRNPDAGIGLEKVAEFGADVVYRFASRVEYSERLRVELDGVDRLPSGSRLSLRLLAQGVDQRWWRHPNPPKRTRVTVEWKESRTGRVSRDEQLLVWPLVIPAGERVAMTLPVHTPPLRGQYRLSVRLPAFDAQSDARTVELFDPS